MFPRLSVSRLNSLIRADDGRKGQSLVVYAIAEGRACADAVNSYLNR